MVHNSSHHLTERPAQNQVSFGTDGIRGKVRTLITPALALQIGFNCGEVLGGDAPFLIGRDSRSSGEMLSAALTAGLTAAGKEVWDIGICPTPAIPYLIRNFNASGGLMVSASHNPPEDNGIKIFEKDGSKLDCNHKNLIEKALNQQSTWRFGSPHNHFGKSFTRDDLLKSYTNSLLCSIGAKRLDGLRIVLDLCWGSATACGLSLFQKLGAKVIVINGTPDGQVINVGCGSTNLGPLRRKVLETNADMGFAFDGDADRMLAIDGKGRVLDGDHILYLWGTELQYQGDLPGQKLVATVMSNLGFENAWTKQGGKLIRTQVGDEFVHKAMIENNVSLGGEQSGHILSSTNQLSGDGLLTALQISTICRSKEISLETWLNTSFKPYPQKLVNIHVPNQSNRCEWVKCEPLQEAVMDAEAAMGNEGRVLVRASGTEPLLRVMVEASDQEAVESWTSQLANLADHHLNAA